MRQSRPKNMPTNRRNMFTMNKKTRGFCCQRRHPRRNILGNLFKGQHPAEQIGHCYQHRNRGRADRRIHHDGRKVFQFQFTVHKESDERGNGQTDRGRFRRRKHAAENADTIIRESSKAGKTRKNDFNISGIGSSFLGRPFLFHANQCDQNNNRRGKQNSRQNSRHKHRPD